MELTEKQINIINEYHENEMYKLKQICNPLIYRKGVSAMYHDDLYAVASDTLLESIKSYDDSKGCTFKTYLIGNIHRAFYDWTRDSRRGKRCNVQRDNKGKIERDESGNPIIIPDISLDAPTNEGIDIVERIDSGFQIEDELPEEIGFSFGENIEEYLDTLSEIQKKIAKSIMTGYTQSEIRVQLGLTKKQFAEHFAVMRSYEKKRKLYKECSCGEEKRMDSMDTAMNDVAETFKNTSYSIDSISKQLQKKRIRDDHILQRHSGQWKGFAKSELISDILRGKSLTQIIISEEIKNKVRMQWLIDGKQRCTTLDDYLHDGFAISKNVKNYNIKYQVPVLNEDGSEKLNEEGFPITDFKECDIRGKKFSKLPEELQDIFRDRQIPVLYNMNCSKKDIADDIARFNRSRPMTAAQNGWLGLDESFAEFVENIVKMPFFQPEFEGSTYTKGNHTSSIIRRVIVESIMVSDFIDSFGDFDKMCEFLSEEAGDSNFTEFYSLVERLTVIANQSVSSLFNAKDSFLWFGLFSKFASLGVEDKKFIDFLSDFSTSEEMQKKEINGESYIDLCIDKKTGKSRSTKDKSIVISKIKLLERLMYEFLHIEIGEKGLNAEENSISEVEIISVGSVSVLDFVRKNVDERLSSDDVELYEMSLDDYTVEVDESAKQIVDRNIQSFVALVAYAFCKEIDDKIPDWLVNYTSRITTYNKDQKENYLHMKQDLEEYVLENKNSEEKST